MDLYLYSQVHVETVSYGQYVHEHFCTKYNNDVYINEQK